MPSSTVLVASEAFGTALNAAQVADAFARGMRAGDPTLLLDLGSIDGSLASSNERIRQARAVVIVAEHLDHRTLLAGGAIFEIATRARQSGVPCYAVAQHNALDLFEARILDLQVVLSASDQRQLVAAGKKLAAMV